jgi:hypothetical protein
MHLMSAFDPLRTLVTSASFSVGRPGAMNRAIVLAFFCAWLAAACGQESASPGSSDQASRSSDAATEKAMPNSWRNPADQPGVKVYRPEALPMARYVSRIQRVEDSNGDYLVVQSGHAGGVGQYTFGNQDRLIAYGGFRSTGDMRRRLSVFEILDLRTELGAAPKLGRSEFEVARIAAMFRAYMDLGAPNHGREIVVVDSRPE